MTQTTGSKFCCFLRTRQPTGPSRERSLFKDSQNPHVPLKDHDEATGRGIRGHYTIHLCARFRPALFHDFTTTFAPGFSPQEVQVLWSFVTVLRCTCVSTAVQCVSSVYLVCFDCLFLSSPSLFRPVCHPQFGIGIRSCHPPVRNQNPIWTGPEPDLPDQNARCSRAWHIPEECVC